MNEEVKYGTYAVIHRGYYKSTDKEVTHARSEFHQQTTN